MGGYPTSPSPYAGTSLLGQRLDPLTLYLYNQPPPAYPPPTATTTLPPDSGYGAAQAAAPSMAQSYASNLAAGQLPHDAATTHQQYGMLRGLDELMRRGISGNSLYPFLQSLIDQGVLYPGEGGVGLSTSLPWSGPQAPKTQRLIDAYESYQDWLNSGNQPVRWPAPGTLPQTGWTIDPNQPRILGTIPPGGAR